jgi:phage terminase large subunit-like protein
MTANPDALALLGALVLENGQRLGDVAQPSQWDLARWFLDPNSTPNRWQSGPRAFGKTTIAAALSISGLLKTIPPGSYCYALAADKDQAALVVQAAAGFVARTPALASAITVQNFRIAARSGSVLEVLAADAASAWGLRPAFVVCDEFCQWPNTRNARSLWEAVSSSLGKVPGAKLLCATTSGDPGHWTHRIYEAALRSPQWAVQDVPGPLPWVSEAFLAEQRAMLPDSVYRRLHLNEWCAPEDRLTNLDDVRACVTLDGALDPMGGYGYVIALDLGVTHDRTVAAVMHSERQNDDDERFVVQRHVLDRMEVWTGSARRPVDLSAVEEWVATTARAYGARLVVDPWQAKGMIQRLRSRGVQVREFLFSQQSAGRLAMTLHTVIRDHRLAIPNDQALIDELLNVRLRETAPNVYRLDHDSDQHDDRAVTLGMALVELTAAPPMSRPFLFNDEHLAYERTLALSGQPSREVIPGWHMAGNFRLNPPAILDDDEEPPGATKESPFV